MKRIKNEAHTNKDRIVCINEQDKLFFYYQIKGIEGLKYLFETKFSPSVSHYFHSRGHSINDNAAYLTIGELYRFNDYHNVRLAHTLERIPGWIDYVLTYELEAEQPVEIAEYNTTEYHDFEYDDERVA